MNAAEALARLKALKVPAFETADAAVALRQTTAAANRTLSRLADAGLIAKPVHGVWWIDGVVDRWRLAEVLTAPFPSYVSLQTALYHHDLIEQIPETIYVVSLSRTKRIRTSAGWYSFHHVAPEVFGGFVELHTGAKMATPEKALFDVAYLSAGRSRLFTALPELELPRRFNEREVGRWVARIPSARHRTITSRKLAELIERGRRSG